MPLPTITEREKRILFFLRMWQIKKRYSPSCGEIARTFCVSKQAINLALTGLKKKGYIEVSNQKDWRHRTVLFPTGTTFPWGNEQLPDELFDHMKAPQTSEVELI